MNIDYFSRTIDDTNRKYFYVTFLWHLKQVMIIPTLSSSQFHLFL